MANTIAIAMGRDKSGRVKETSRLGGASATGMANTWRTFATAHVQDSGRGYVTVKRDGRTIHTFMFGPEEMAFETDDDRQAAHDAGQHDAESLPGCPTCDTLYDAEGN